ncbi:MAG: hypothetical protein IPG66_10695 [Hydrogenophilales bacterium]|nr:hypothetical protein [Hydrogenophilales bacterium]
MTQTYIDPQGQPHVDRRQQRQLRDIFQDFRSTVEPFLRADTTWGGADLSYLARRQIQESHPDLSSIEINVLVQAVLRVMREDRASTS